MAKGYTVQRALPRGYRVSLVGTPLLLVGGVLDFLRHTMFGIEVDLEALLSPPNLFLATSGGLVVSGPMQAAWSRLAPDKAHSLCLFCFTRCICSRSN